MKFLHIAHFDPAAAGWHHRCALRAAGHEAEAVARRLTNCAEYADLVVHEEPAFQADAVTERLRWADVVIAHVGSGEYSSNGCFEPVDVHEEAALAPFRDKLILWANGSHSVRTNPGAYRKRYEGFRGVATNHDIANMLGFQWMPSCIEAEVDAGKRMWRFEATDPLTLAHPYSDSSLKGAADAKNAAGDAAWAYHEVAGLSLGTSFDMRIRRTAVFDHFKGYFGLTTMEASAMGQPSAVGYDDEALRNLREFGAGDPPWARTKDRWALGEQLRSWSRDPVAMATKAADARVWHERNFSNALKIQHFLGWLG